MSLQHYMIMIKYSFTLKIKVGLEHLINIINLYRKLNCSINRKSTSNIYRSSRKSLRKSNLSEDIVKGSFNLKRKKDFSIKKSNFKIPFTIIKL